MYLPILVLAEQLQGQESKYMQVAADIQFGLNNRGALIGYQCSQDQARNRPVYYFNTEFGEFVNNPTGKHAPSRPNSPLREQELHAQTRLGSIVKLSRNAQLVCRLIFGGSANKSVLHLINEEPYKSQYAMDLERQRIPARQLNEIRQRIGIRGNKINNAWTSIPPYARSLSENVTIVEDHSTIATISSGFISYLSDEIARYENLLAAMMSVQDFSDVQKCIMGKGRLGGKYNSLFRNKRDARFVSYSFDLDLLSAAHGSGTDFIAAMRSSVPMCGVPCGWDEKRKMIYLKQIKIPGNEAE